MFTFDLYQRPSSEEACSILLPVVATVVMLWEPGREQPQTEPHTETTTNFLPRRITTMANTRRRTEQASSDEGL